MKKLFICLLLVLSFTFSRLLLSLVRDAEGPNLFIMAVIAMIIFIPLSVVYLRRPKAK